MAFHQGVPFSLQEKITGHLKPKRVCLMREVGLNHPTQAQGKATDGSYQLVSPRRAEARVLVLTRWRGYLFFSRQPVRVDTSFSYLEICSIEIHSLNQVVVETDTANFSLSLYRMEDLEAMVSQVTASLKKIFPDSSPGRLLKEVPPELQERLCYLTSQVEEQLEGVPGLCGGFSDAYAALCDFNNFPCKEEIQWDVDNIYHVHNCREFNLLDFSHLDKRDLSLAVAALSFNQWFTKLFSKLIKLPPEVQQQILLMVARSPSLEWLSLEASGLKHDFVVKMAAALKEHASSALHAIILSSNQIEDKGVIALSQQLQNLPAGLTHLSLAGVSLSAKGLGVLAQSLSSSQVISRSLKHLDLSGNPGSLATEEAMSLFGFLSTTNAVCHLDLSGTDCPLDTLFVSLSAGCCSSMVHLNLAKNPFTLRKVQSVTQSVKQFFGQSCELKFVGLSGTRLPHQALSLLLQGLATNTKLCGLELDVSSCELRSAGAQVIQEHIFEARAISSLDLSDNAFEGDMVTLVLSIGRCRSLCHLSLGRNFAMKSRALTDVLERIVQLVQEDECPLESLSVCDSKLKTGTTILINSLGCNASLSRLDISGNSIGDTGAKMLAKALASNTKLRTLVWDRNNVTARGYQDVANALERNFTLQQISLPLADLTQGYRSNPDRTEEAITKIQQCLMRNNQMQTEGVERLHSLKTHHSEKEVLGLCQQLQDSLQPLTHVSTQAVQEDILSAEEVLLQAKTSIKLLPCLFELTRTPSSGERLQHILSAAATALSDYMAGDLQELSRALQTCLESECPGVSQGSGVCERLAQCVSRRGSQTQLFLQTALLENTATTISNKLCEMRQAVCVSLVDGIVQQVLQDLALTQDKLDQHTKKNAGSAYRNNVPQLRLVDHEFPTDEYHPVIWRNSFHSKSIRPAPSVKK